EDIGQPTNLASPALRPPEWVSGTGVSSQATLAYRVGALMYEMLTGSPPFAGGNAVETIARVLHEMPEAPRNVNPKVERDLEAVCMKCLAKDPRARYVSLKDLLDRLKTLPSS